MRILFKLYNFFIAHRLQAFLRQEAGRHCPGIHPSVKIKDSMISGNLRIGEFSKIINNVRIHAGSNITIGRYTSLNGPGTSVIGQLNEINIGSFCSIARGVDIQEFNHFSSRPSTYFILQNIFNENYADVNSKGPITIGHDVWIGAQSVILSGARIGNGAIIAANSVVNCEIPPFSIAGGSPAKVIKMRFSPEIIDKIETDPWWNWSIQKIERNKSFFENDLTIESFKFIRD